MRGKLIGLFSLILAASLAAAAPAGSRDKGFDLIDMYVVMFKGLADSGTGGPDALNAALDKIMNETVKAREQAAIDPIFDHRFRRLLMVTKLAALQDKARILTPVVERELGRFIEDVEGKVLNLEGGKEGIGIGAVADALAEEIVNLQILLEGKKDRERLKREFMKSFQAGPEKK